MSNLFSGISGRFRGTQSRANQNKPPTGGSSNSSQGPAPSPGLQTSSSTGSLAPRVPAIPASPSLASSLGGLDGGNDSRTATPQPPSDDPLAIYNLPRPKPIWLNAGVAAKHIVKGNFMTLTTKPKTVEQGEWVAHQTVEHFRVLWLFVRPILDKLENGTPICSKETCPKMSAGKGVTFTWLNQRREPLELPAREYIQLMHRWIQGKIDSMDTFPTDPTTVSFAQAQAPTVPPTNTFPGASTPTSAGTPQPIPAGPTNLNASVSSLSGQEWVGKSSGFPAHFIDTCQMIFKQMFRIYAHLYWDHFVEPFWHLSLEKQLNSCFSHFLLTGVELDLLTAKDMACMQPLIDLWAANGTFPIESKIYKIANVDAGKKLIELSGASA